MIVACPESPDKTSADILFFDPTLHMNHSITTIRDSRVGLNGTDGHRWAQMAQMAQMPNTDGTDEFDLAQMGQN